MVIGALSFPAVAQAAPLACFTQSPAGPYYSGATITFNASCSSGYSARGWDLDNDGSFDDGSGTTASRTFNTPGTYTVRLGVIDDHDRYDIESKEIVVSNRPPVSTFTYTPSAPKSGESITFTSTSTDQDGTIASQSWDFDGDGFDDGTTATVTKSFATPGTITARLRVVDNRGAEHTSTQTVTIANRAPVASFSTSASPTTGSPVTFTSTSTDPDGSIASQAWELDNTNDFNDGTGTTTSRTYTTPGTYTIKLRVRDNTGSEDVETKTVTIGNRAPIAAFDVAPVQPISKQAVTFTSASSDPDGTIASQAWEFDGTNDFDDGTGTTATRTFDKPGTYTVKLRVIDNSGTAKIASHAITVANRPPTGSFTHTPSAPLTGDAVDLTATTADDDGTIARQAWDLDNDGQFDDATGATASFTPRAAGNYPVGFKVTDDSGDSTIATDTIVVADRALPKPVEPAAGGDQFDTTGPLVPQPDPGVNSPVAPTLRWLSPFPVVRIRGVATRQGAKVTLLSVTAPAGVTATLRCAGGGCPAKRLTAKVKAAKGKGVGVVRFRKMERSLPAGTRLEVAVTADGLVGKYTRFTIRRLAGPVRTDRCMVPGTARPSTCPSTS